MEEPLIIFQTKFNEYLERIDAESNNIKEILKEVNAGNARTGHFNRMEESINKIKELLKLISRNSIREDLIKDEVKKRLQKILRVSTLMAKEPERITQEQADEITGSIDAEQTAMPSPVAEPVKTEPAEETLPSAEPVQNSPVEEPLPVVEPAPVESIIIEPVETVLSEPKPEDQNAN